ncbi:MAG TPA: translational GTPase TypA [Chloroflexota bacterium]|nr:translational GTPase TypA [Chloroflexota bacterium]
MSYSTCDNIRNVAIIAHVDHGKTTLVDGMLKQSGLFRANEQVGELILDSNDLEREKGITILAKNTAVMYRGVKINIIDTPGHADFSGEVERVLNMADGALLLVDAVEGPMPQTKYVLKKALEIGLKPIVVINKVDRQNARPGQVLDLTEHLFLDLATDPEQLEFPVLYAVGRDGVADTTPQIASTSLEPLFETILRYVPPPVADPAGLVQMLVTTLDYDDYKGKFAIGRLVRGTLRKADPVALVKRDGTITRERIALLFTHQGLKRTEIEEAKPGDIIAVTGLPNATIGDTIGDALAPEALPPIRIEEPTVKMTFGVNTSPLAGREGRWSTSRQLRERLFRELETNVALRVAATESPDEFLVSGRGELHLAILIETIRREGYEFQVSRPEAVTKVVEGKLFEPIEHLTVDTSEEYIGPVTEALAARQGQMANMQNDGRGNVRLEYTIPTRGLIGFRNEFLTITRGNGLMGSLLLDREPWRGPMGTIRNGALVASESGTAVTYGLLNAQERGTTFVEPGTVVYQGMIVGLYTRQGDLAVNVCKQKAFTNVRASTAEIDERLTPATILSLEQSLDFIADDELLEVTPKSLRLRKKLLDPNERARARKEKQAALSRGGG